MSDSEINVDRVFDLTGVICDENASESDFAEMDTYLLADRSSCNRYLGYCWMHVALSMELQVQLAVQKVHQQINIGSVIPTASEFEITAKAETPAFPSPTFLPTTLHGTLGYLSSDWSVSYLIATVIMGIGALIAGFTYVSHPVQVAERLPVVANDKSVIETQKESVGQIIGMIDSKWADSLAAPVSAHLVMGQKITLTSGLLEIAYNTGAKVILEGPVTYEVESKNGGYLSIGKLTGKVESETAKGFTVCTPTAIVTDLGTEFGVDVSKEGQTTSHVFRGSVRVQRVDDAERPEGNGQVLHENESVRVDRRNGINETVVLSTPAASGFVRELPKKNITKKVKVFDLVDVVAGGDGFSGRRNAGIDPTNGRPTTTLTADRFEGDGQYHRVEGLPFVDGVFIPNGRAGGVLVDSAGHAFSEFPKTDNFTSGHVWVVGGEISAMQPNPIRTTLGGVDYGSSGHGLLFLHANKGITFDLEAIRRANPGWKLRRFLAVAGNTELCSAVGTPVVFADVWVLVDGQVRFRRREITGLNAAFSVAIPINENDRFLTLVGTDGGNGYVADWILFGDPRLELVSAITTIEKGGAPTGK